MEEEGDFLPFMGKIIVEELTVLWTRRNISRGVAQLNAPSDDDAK
jgi:hypothetical protein